MIFMKQGNSLIQKGYQVKEGQEPKELQDKMRINRDAAIILYFKA